MIAATHLMRWFYVVALLLIASGCGASYRQPLAEDKATIRMETKNDTFIAKVDDASTAGTASLVFQSFSLFSGGKVPVGTLEVSVTPGKHTIEIQSYYATADLWLVAEPAKQYIVRTDKTKHGQAIWIEDEATGTPVGGRKGSIDEPPDGTPETADNTP